MMLIRLKRSTAKTTAIGRALRLTVA